MNNIKFAILALGKIANKMAKVLVLKMEKRSTVWSELKGQRLWMNL